MMSAVALKYRLEKLASFFFMPVEEGLDQASQGTFGPVGSELDGVHQDLTFSFELDDLLWREDALNGQLFGQLLDSRAEESIQG